MEEKMFDFGNANKQQKLAITTTDGPVLITAGPGTGKTYTLVQRAIYLIQEKGLKPEQIMIATFTEKAAKELVTRITNELANKNIIVNINEMYIGTFHSICLRMIKENLEYTRFKKNYRTLDAFDQQYIIFQNINKFKAIENYDLLFSTYSWKMANEISVFVNNLLEELVDYELLKRDSDVSIRVLGEVLQTYIEILEENNLVDFASIQLEAYRLLRENPTILQEFHDKVEYIMIDEYQDTNYIQEQLVFLLAGERQNICVVGDDDQGLYRFRGATIRNILEFPEKFPENACEIIPLVVNYRSNSDIVDFYNNWMSTTEGKNFKFSWEKFRYDKTIVSHEKTKLSSPAVVKITSENNVDEWHENILAFITKLKKSGKISNYNQIAFLFKSLKNDNVKKLSDFLESNNINVYSPRSDMFFERTEIKLLLGILMVVFPQFAADVENNDCKYLGEKHYEYFNDCIRLAKKTLEEEKYSELKKWVISRGKTHVNLKNNTDYNYSGLIYQVFEFEPFKTILDTDVTRGTVDKRPLRNLSQFSQIIGKYEYLYNINVITPKSVVKDTENLFSLYIKFLLDGGVNEYEDDSEYAPSGCVSFLTIHQSKGMEFPIVIVDSLSSLPRKSHSDLMLEIENKYFKRQSYEPYDKIKYFDFWRLYYTAFSRAQDLLVLTCNETKRVPSKYFVNTYSQLVDVNDNSFSIDEFSFKEVKDVNLKETFSFTSHITLFENCALQYKFYKEFGFMPVRAGAMVFGHLVHQTIEDIHRAALRHEENTITEENIQKWFNSNYDSISKSEHTYLATPQLESALNQVLRYVSKQNGDWHLIQQAEVDVSLVKLDYIIGGKIDLIKGEDGTVEIVDFKSEKKPDLSGGNEYLEQYKRQLQLYAYLVEERTGYKVSKMHLYYTGEEGSNPTITFPYQKMDVENTIDAFDSTVKRIMKKDFSKCSTNPKLCRECDFRHYCRKNKEN